MRKILLVLVLLASVFHQSVSSAGARSAHVDHDLAHAMLHWDGEPHHHHADGSLEKDQSDESLDHLKAEAASNLQAVVSSPAPQPAFAPPAEMPAFQPSAPPSPALKAPKRPPRLPA